ncbi:unnamed protein product [Ixodes persulcatus]
MADMDNVVSMVTTDARRTMPHPKPGRRVPSFTEYSPIPACPTTQDSRKNRMTPQMLSRHRTLARTRRKKLKRSQLNCTPCIHPSFTAPLPLMATSSAAFLTDFSNDC